MTVVVGVDGSPDSHAAIRLARREALFRNSSLVAVMAYAAEGGVMSSRPVRPAGALNTAEQRDITEATLSQVVRDALGEDATEVEIRVIQGVPGHALVQAAKEAEAQMVVLTARSDGAVSRLLGTVSQFVLRNAPCPVLVVPAGT
jgi:nucleotide-binding universal stress UspA family protein